MLTVQAAHHALLDLLETCTPSDGVIDVPRWEAAGCPAVDSATAAPFVVPSGQRRIRRCTLAERIATGQWAFSSTPGGVASVEATHTAAEALHFWGDLEQLPMQARQAWADTLNDWQDPATGYFLGPYVRPRTHASWRDPRCSHPWAHMHDHLVSCVVPTLLLLGAVPRTPLSRGSQTGRFLDRGYLRDFLERDWSGYRQDGDYRRQNPWWLGNEFWYPGCILWAIWRCEAGTPAATQARELLDQEWYGWHDRNLNQYGLWEGTLAGDPAQRWRGELAADAQITGIPTTRAAWRWASFQVMGGAHQLWLYDHDGHLLPAAQRAAQTDLLLAMQHASDHRFGLDGPDTAQSDSNDCTDVDCLTLLAYNHVRQDYRRADIAAACTRAATALLRDKIDGHGVFASRPGRAWAHHAQSHETFSPADAPNMHQQAFSLWALLSALRPLDRCTDPVLEAWRAYPWRTMPGHWLWVPPR